MTLNEFRLSKNLSYRSLSRALGFNDANYARRWCLAKSEGGKIPSHEHMILIQSFTNGAVQPNDFYRSDG